MLQMVTLPLTFSRYRRQGAIMLLQAWWRRMKTVILLRKIMADYRWKMAVRIQGVWRAYSQWRKFASKKRLWLEELAVMRIAATVRTQPLSSF